MADDVETVELPVFRADHRASKGITAAMLADVAAFDCDSNPVPNIYGHAEGFKPAMDRVRGFRVAGDTLFAAVPKATAAAKKIWQGIKDGSILNRSMCFFDPADPQNPTPGKLAPRHLGWLGANAPGMPGLPALHKLVKGLAFEGDELQVTGDPADAVMFEAGEPTEPTAVHRVPPKGEKKEFETVADQETPEAKALREGNEKLAADKLQFEADQKAVRDAANDAAIDGLVAKGKVLPAEAAGLKLIFGAIAPAPLEFEAGKPKLSPTAQLAAFLDTAITVKRAPVDSGRVSPETKFEATDTKSAEEIEGAARELMKTRPGLSFEAAVSEVSGQK